MSIHQKREAAQKQGRYSKIGKYWLKGIKTCM